MWDTQGDGIEAGRRVLDDDDPGLLAAAMSFQLPEDGKAEDSKSNCIIL